MVKMPVLDWIEGFSGAVDACGAELRLGRTPLKDIRMQAVSSYSDADLRNALSRLTRQAISGGCEDNLATVFAMVNEAISRRLGAWRFFDPLIDPIREQSGLLVFHQLADRISHIPDFEQAANNWRRNGSTCWESFDRAVTPVLVHQGLDPRDRVLVVTILFLRHRSQVELAGSILLPSCFYQALQAQDQDGVLIFRATDEQLLAGILLYQGKVVEMNAGEGKTIAAAFPAVLHAVHGRNVHIITANDYLANRDAEWLAPVFESLGLSVSAVLEFMDDSERRSAYGKDIVYGPLREFGFDFMRDNLKLSSTEVVQRGLDVAIVDEADHALIDEANIPLIIAGESGAAPKIPAKLRIAIEQLVELQTALVSDLEQQVEDVPPRSKDYFRLLSKLYLADPDGKLLRKEFAADFKCLKRVRRTITTCRIDDEYDSLTGDLFYWIDRPSEHSQGKSLCLTGKGQDFIETRLGLLFEDLAQLERASSVQANIDLPLAFRRKEVNKLSRQLARRQDRMHQVVRMLWGYVLLKKDVDYLVRDDQVVLIDRYTGRGRPDTRYHHGLQAALEVKEGVPVRPEPEVLGRISVRGFIHQYSQVSGMTGTALSSKTEFRRSYSLDVVAVPPSKSLNRTDLEPRIYASNQDKLRAIVDEVQLCHRMGRPVLIGTHSIDECDAISWLLTRGGIEHNLLNAANDMEEERVINEAGRFGAVTVATDMAGRGTDIILEDGLDRRIADCYAVLTRQMLTQGADRVTFECQTKGAAEILLSAIASETLDCSVVTSQRSGGTCVVVSSNAQRTYIDTVSLNEESSQENSVYVDFRLGLYVIGTENSDIGRVDDQLKGRSGRQGAFGASRFFLSSEDSLLKFGGDAGLVSSRLIGSRLDSAGRTFWEGEPLTRHLEKLRKSVERDAESRRALIEEYTRVFEAQSFAYYRARKDILSMESFEPFRSCLVVTKAEQLVQKYFSGLLVDDYARQFNGLSEELTLDYKVDISDLWGLDLNLLDEELALLISARLDRSGARFSDEEYGKLGKLLYLQTSDELWRDHMSHVQSLVLATQLCGHNGRGDLAAYTLSCFESYEHIQDRIVDSFLPKLSAFPGELSAKQESRTAELRVELSEDVNQILT
jgi:preprotein translocase subunit SecA